MSDIGLRLVLSADGSQLQGEVKSADGTLQKFNSTLDQAGTSADRLAKRIDAAGASMQRSGRNLSIGLTAPLLAAATAASKLAIDATETANKFDVVFRGSLERVNARLLELRDTVPLTITEMRELSAGVQDLLVPLGLARGSASDLSVQALELAADLGSFNNAGTEEVLEAIKSSLAGSSEPMRRFGVDTRETRLQAIALTEGIIKQGQELDGAARAQAVFAAITADSSDALGDAARTAGDNAAQIRFIRRDILEAAEAIGNDMLPVVSELITGVRGITQSLTEMDSETRRNVIIGGAAAALIGPAIVALGSVLRSLVAIRGAIIAINVAARANPLGAIITAAGVLAGGLAVVIARSQTAERRLIELGVRGDEAAGKITAAFNAVSLGEIDAGIREIEAAFNDLQSQIDQIDPDAEIFGGLTGSNQIDALKDSQDELLVSLGELLEKRRELLLQQRELTQGTEDNTEATGDNTDATGDNTDAVNVNKDAVNAALQVLGNYGTEQDKLALIEAERTSAIDLLTQNQESLEASGISLADAIDAINRRADDQVAALTGAGNEADEFTRKIDAMLIPISSADEQLLLLNLALEEALNEGNVERADRITAAIERLAGAGDEAGGAFDGLAEDLANNIGRALANGQGIGEAIGTSLTSFGLSGLTDRIAASFKEAFADLDDDAEEFGESIAFALGRAITVGGEQGAGAGLLAGAGAIIGTQIGGALSDIASDIGEDIGGAIGEKLGAIAGPAGAVIGGIIGDIIGDAIFDAFTKAPRISISGDADVERFGTKDVEALQTDLGEVFLGLRKIPPEVADQIRRAIQEFDKAIATAIDGAGNLDAINAALAEFDQQAKAKKFSTGELLEARFNAVLSAFDGFTQGIVNQASLLEDRIERLNDIIDIGTRFALGDTLGLTGAGFNPAPAPSPAPIGPPSGGGGPGGSIGDPGFGGPIRIQSASDDVAKFNSVIAGTGDAADVSSPALQQTIAIVDELARTGETLSDSFERLLESTAALDQLGGLLGTTFGESRDDLIRFGDSLTRAFGDDLDRLTSGLETISERFFSAGEVLENDAELARQRASELFGTLGIEVTDALFTESGFREAFESLADILSPEELAILIEAGVAVDALLHSQEELAAIEAERVASLEAGINSLLGITETEVQSINRRADALAELAQSEAELTEIERARTAALAEAEAERRASLREGINELLGIQQSEIDQINQRADALLGLATTQQEVLEVEFARQAALSALADDLLASVQSISEQLLGQSGGSLVGRSLGGISRVNDAVDDRFRREVAALESIGDLIDDLLLSSISPLTPEQRLAEARAQLDAAFAAAEGGDVDALESLPDLVNQFLGELSSFTGGVGIFPDEFQATLDRLADLQASGPQAPEPVTGQQVGGIASSASSIEQSALEQVQLAQQLIQQLGLLADLDQDVLQILEDSGLSLEQLTEFIGVDLKNLSAEQVGILGGLAEEFGLSLDELQNELGISLGALTDATGLLNDGFELALSGLPPEIAGPIEDALRDAEETGDVTELERLVNELAPGFRNELAPFFDDIDITSQADAQIDELTKINVGIEDMVTGLEPLTTMAVDLGRIADNLQAQNSEAGIPAFALGSGSVPRTGPALVHAGEIILPSPVSDFARRSGLSIGPGGDSTAVVQRLERLEALLEAGNDQRKNQTGVISSGNAAISNSFSELKFSARRDAFVGQQSRGGGSCGG